MNASYTIIKSAKEMNLFQVFFLQSKERVLIYDQDCKEINFYKQTFTNNTITIM